IQEGQSHYEVSQRKREQCLSQLNRSFKMSICSSLLSLKRRFQNYRKGFSIKQKKKPLLLMLAIIIPFATAVSMNSTVVIWSNPIGSYQDHGLLLGKYLCKDTVNRGALGQLVMDEHQEPLKQRTPLLPTGVPNGLDEAPCSIRYGRQTGQVQQRVGHEDQTPMFSDGFGSSHTILVEAQVPLTVLIKRFRRPALRIQADDLRGVPVHTVGHQHDMPSCQRLALKTDHDPDLAQGGDTNPQREAPIGVLAYCDGAIGIGRDQRHERLDRHVRAWQLQRPAIGIPQVKTGRFQPTVRFEQADPVLAPSDQDLDQVLRQVPSVEHHHPKGHLAPDGLFDQLDRQGNFGLKLLVPRP